MATVVKWGVAALVLMVVATNLSLVSKCNMYTHSCTWGIKVQ